MVTLSLQKGFNRRARGAINGCNTSSRRRINPSITLIHREAQQEDPTEILRMSGPSHREAFDRKQLFGSATHRSLVAEGSGQFHRRHCRPGVLTQFVSLLKCIWSLYHSSFIHVVASLTLTGVLDSHWAEKKLKQTWKENRPLYSHTVSVGVDLASHKNSVRCFLCYLLLDLLLVVVAQHV